jgi:hypothetical protein
MSAVPAADGWRIGGRSAKGFGGKHRQKGSSDCLVLISTEFGHRNGF